MDSIKGTTDVASSSGSRGPTTLVGIPEPRRTGLVTYATCVWSWNLSFRPEDKWTTLDVLGDGNGRTWLAVREPCEPGPAEKEFVRKLFSHLCGTGRTDPPGSVAAPPYPRERAMEMALFTAMLREGQPKAPLRHDPVWAGYRWAWPAPEPFVSVTVFDDGFVTVRNGYGSASYASETGAEVDFTMDRFEDAVRFARSLATRLGKGLSIHECRPTVDAHFVCRPGARTLARLDGRIRSAVRRHVRDLPDRLASGLHAWLLDLPAPGGDGPWAVRWTNHAPPDDLVDGLAEVPGAASLHVALAVASVLARETGYVVEGDDAGSEPPSVHEHRIPFRHQGPASPRKGTKVTDRVLEALRGGQPARKVDIAERIGIGRGSVNRAVEILREKGLVTEVRPGRFGVPDG